MTDVTPNITDLPYCLEPIRREAYNRSAVFEFERSFEKSDLQTYLPSEWRGYTLIKGSLKLPVAPMFRSTVVTAMVDGRLMFGYMEVTVDARKTLNVSILGFSPATEDSDEMEDHYSIHCDLEKADRGEGASFVVLTPEEETWRHEANPAGTATGICLGLFMYLSDTLSARPDRVQHARGPEPRPMDDERTQPSVGPNTPKVQWRPGRWIVAEGGDGVRYEWPMLVHSATGRPVDTDTVDEEYDSVSQKYPVYKVSV